MDYLIMHSKLHTKSELHEQFPQPGIISQNGAFSRQAK